MAWGLQLQIHVQGLRKVMSSSPGLVNFVAEQVQLACPMGKGACESPSNNIVNISLARSGPGQEKCEICFPKGQAGTQVFNKPRM